MTSERGRVQQASIGGIEVLVQPAKMLSGLTAVAVVASRSRTGGYESSDLVLEENRSTSQRLLKKFGSGIRSNRVKTKESDSNRDDADCVFAIACDQLHQPQVHQYQPPVRLLRGLVALLAAVDALSNALEFKNTRKQRNSSRRSVLPDRKVLAFADLVYSILRNVVRQIGHPSNEITLEQFFNILFSQDLQSLPQW